MPMRVLCLGEPLVTLTPPPHTSLAIADTAYLGIGGAELNVAIHLARLGVEVSYAGAVGADPFGVRIREALHDEGADCTLLVQAEGATGLYCKEPDRTLYYRSESAGSRLSTLPPAALVGIAHVHLTGVTFGLSGDIVRAAEELCVRPRTWRLSFDVNYRPALWPVDVAGPSLLRTAQSADVVFVGRDEAEVLWNLTDRDEVRALVGSDAELVIKDGAAPVDVWADGRWWRATPPSIDVAEPVGAGDAFAAAYLAARLRGSTPLAAAERGHRLAGHVMTTVSDQGVRGADAYRNAQV